MLLVCFLAVRATAQDIFISSKGNVTELRANQNDMVFSENGTKVTIQGNQFATADIDSITLNAPSTMKFSGADISMLPSFEASSLVAYYDQNGNKIDDVVKYFKEQGINAMRVRLFVNPKARSGEPPVVQSLDYITPLCKRIKDAGCQLMLDFQYSDSWADPAKQYVPAAWSACTTDNIGDTVYNYTKRCLQHLTANNAQPDFIQIGNEISYGMLYDIIGKCYTNSDGNWKTFCTILNRAAAACREICPKAKIIIHTERTGNTETTVAIYNRMKENKVDYDIIGLSYYPIYQGSLAQLETTLNSLADNFADKKVVIAETSYNYIYKPDNVSYDFTSTWPYTEDGQAQFTADLITTLLKHSNVNGMFWWYAEENDYATDGSKWNKVYDPWVNRGFFNCNNGYALKALYKMKDYK